MLVTDDEWVDALKKTIPELPDEKKARFIDKYRLPSYDADLLTSSRELADFFEECLKEFPNAKQVSNWVMGTLLGLLNAEGKTVKQSPVSAVNLAGLLKLIDEGIISGKIAKTVFEEMAKSGKSPKEIVKEKGLVQVTDVSSIESVISQVLARCSDEVEDYKKGKTKLLGFFVGQVMKESNGKANPKIVNEVLRSKLGG